MVMTKVNGNVGQKQKLLVSECQMKFLAVCHSKNGSWMSLLKNLQNLYAIWCNLLCHTYIYSAQLEDQDLS